MLWRFITVALACTLSACTVGTVDEPPTAPTPPVILSAITITPVGGGALLVGSSVPIATTGTVPGASLGAFAQYTNGTGQYVEAVWNSSDESIIAIDGGHLVARARGEAVVTASFQGKTDSETFRVEGGVAGRWRGSYVVEQCAGSTGSMAEILCNPPGTSRPVGIAAVGNVLPFAMEISEQGTDLTAIVSFGNIRGRLTGKNRGGGFFFLQGLIEETGGAINIIHWDTRVTRDAMEGFIGYQIRMPNLPGFGTIAAKLVDMTRQ